MTEETKANHQLRRELGVFGAMMLGLGSIVGTGVFVSIGIAAGVTGPSVVLAIFVAAIVATFNGLSSAQLAANHPVSGGTYEYAYRWLNGPMGFTAGWMFLCAKSASAATAALGAAGYLMRWLTIAPSIWDIVTAMIFLVIITLVVLDGIRRSNLANTIIVLITLLTLAAFVLGGISLAAQRGNENLSPFFSSEQPALGFLEACALMFVAFTGYGRIATLGEEVVRPKVTIPKAIIATLFASSALYISVSLVSVAIVPADEFAIEAETNQAPLEFVARQLEIPGLVSVIGFGAITAMLGVLLNLVLGLSRVVLAMGRRRDLPSLFGNISAKRSVPIAATLFVAIFIAILVLIGNVKTTWSFSAFTVLIYYSITNFTATRLSKEERLYPAFIPWCGLASCLGLAFFVDPTIWLIGLGLIAAGLVFYATLGRYWRSSLAASDIES